MDQPIAGLGVHAATIHVDKRKEKKIDGGVFSWVMFIFLSCQVVLSVFTCMLEYVMAFTSVPCGCLVRSNVSPSLWEITRKMCIYAQNAPARAVRWFTWLSCTRA